MKLSIVLQILFILLVPVILLSQNAMPDRSEILAGLELSANGKTEVVKKFPEGFPEVLVERGNPLVYTKENSNNFEYIGMPVGGIGAGQLYLGGDGQLWFWDIFSLNHNMGQLKGEEAYEFPYKRSEPGAYGTRKIDQGFSVTTRIDGESITRVLNRDGIDEVEFLGQYPIGQVTYRDQNLPVLISMEAYSPFIPLDLENSILPATIFDFKIRNTSKEPVEAALNGWMENAVLIGTREQKGDLNGLLVNRLSHVDELGKRITYSVETSDASLLNRLSYGSMTLSLISNEGRIVSHPESVAKVDLSDTTALIGDLGVNLYLEPGEEKTATFILTWYFPKTYAAQNKWKKSPEEIGHAGADTTRYYASLFGDALDVSDYIIQNYKYLSGNTRNWRDTWYDSSLPYWFLDRTFLNTSILASSTSSLIGDRLFYGTEGGNQGPGTCTHVWGYAQAMGRLFPSLEQSLREQVDFKPVSEGGALKDNGVVKFRWFNHGMAVDGQSGIIMKTYLIHQMSADDTFLKKNYDSIKKVMQGLTERNDADQDGILTGPQHNTLDADWYGKVTWLSLYYTAALRAMAEMADEMGDTEYAGFCKETADKGRQYIEEHLYNGEYFIHEADPEKTDSPGTYNGLEYSQLLGQSWAYQVGLGEIVDRAKAKTALESMWRYNFSTDVGPFREVNPSGRWYAMPGEGGLIACTWPQGGKDVLEKGNPRFAAYNNECQNGYEYAATSLMMWHDMPYHALAHIWYMHNNRYHGAKRNPWCEIEWGLHYSRSMASYGHFIAVSGFEYHGPKGYMAFSPKITPDNFRSAFTAAEGWGSFEQKRKNGKQVNVITVNYGELNLRTLSFDIPVAGIQIKNVDVKLNDKKADYTSHQQSDRIVIVFNQKMKIGYGDTIEVSM